MNEVIDVAVIGAGPAGLVLARQLQRTEASFEVFERHLGVGGIWDIDAPGSPMYESAHFISSREQSGFEGFPMPESYPDYPSHRQILDYIRAFATAYDLERHIRFGAEVEAATLRDDGDWQLRFADGSERRARYLICANGVTWIPNEITWPGPFDGEIRHSVTYRSFDEFRGRRVLIVGAGNSGVDIACDAAFAADQAFLSMRRGYHFLPKHIMGVPTDAWASRGPKMPLWLQQQLFEGVLRVTNGDYARYGLPTPDHRLLESHPIMNTQILHFLAHGDCIAKPDVSHLDRERVVFTDGSSTPIDLIIQATGYHHRCPFLDPGVLEDEGGRPDLYLEMFSRTHPNLAVLGFIEFASSAYRNFERMGELIVADAVSDAGSTLRRNLADRKQNHHPDLRGGRRYVASARHANYVEVETYLQELHDAKAALGISRATQTAA